MCKILFANISYQYDGEQEGNFRFVRDTGNAMDKYNFEPVFWNGRNVCLGFFEAGFTKGGYETGNRRQVHIEKIVYNYNNKPFIDDVLVVWCATINKLSMTSIVGWYNHARVYRQPQCIPYNTIPNRGLKEWGYLYNVQSDASNCIALPHSEILSGKWKSPRKNKDGFGFGQSNMWYAREEKAKDYVDNVIKQIIFINQKLDIV